MKTWDNMVSCIRNYNMKYFERKLKYFLVDFVLSSLLFTP